MIKFSGLVVYIVLDWTVDGRLLQIVQLIVESTSIDIVEFIRPLSTTTESRNCKSSSPFVV